MGKRAKNTHFLFLLAQIAFHPPPFLPYQPPILYSLETHQTSFYQVFNRLLKTSENIFQKLCGELWGIV